MFTLTIGFVRRFIDRPQRAKYNAASGVMSDRTLPIWARVLDGVALSCLVAGISVIVTGGGREWTPLGRLSVTSWDRPLALAAMSLLSRHWYYPRPSVLARLWSMAAASRLSIASRAVWAPFLYTRIGVFVVAFLGIGLIGHAPNMPAFQVYGNDLLDLPVRWDAGWYMGIADHGYRWDSEHPQVMQNIAFFPMYPLLMRYGSLLVGHQYVLAGVLVSLISFFFALKYFFGLARQAIGDDGAATAVALLAAYPFAFYYSALYTEAVFLLAAIATCYHFERAELAKAAGWGLVTGLVRPNGCLLSVVLAIMVLGDCRRSDRRTIATRLFVAAMPGAGLLLYSAYIYTLTGNPLQWADNHAAYGRVYKSIWTLIVERVGYIRADGFYGYAAGRSLDLVNLIPTLFALGAVWPVYQKFGAPYAALILINVLVPLHMGGVLSMGRLTSTMFPLFLWLAAAIAPERRTGWLMLFGMLQALLAVAFFTWRPLY